MERVRCLSSLVVVGLLASRVAAQLPLDFVGTTYPTGACPATIAAADLDEDGTLDLLVANHHTHEFSVYAGDGSGSLETRPGVPVTGQHDSHALSLAMGDFDEDGHIDAATSSFANNEVIVFLGKGDGSFGEYLPIPVGRFSVRVASGDLDGDGHLDLASCNRDDGEISLLAGDGDGAFAAPRTLAAGKAPTAIEAADMDGDMHLDLVTADSVGKTVTLLLGDGTGAFPETTTIEGFENTGYALPVDLDGNGVLDLAVAHGDRVSILGGKGSAGSGDFEARGDLVTGSNSLMVGAGDWNDDGRLDIVTANWRRGDVSLYLAEGTWGFAAPKDLPAGEAPWGVLAADLDGDGRDDLVVTNELENTMTVFLNRTFERAPFRRADANADTQLDISDGVFILDFLFLGRAVPRCRAALDANADSEVNITDGVYVLQHLFSGGPAPPEPFRECGIDEEAPFNCLEPTGGCESPP